MSARPDRKNRKRNIYSPDELKIYTNARKKSKHTKKNTKAFAEVDAKVDTKAFAKVDTKAFAKADTKDFAKAFAEVDAKVDTKAFAKVDTKAETKISVDDAKFAKDSQVLFDDDTDMKLLLLSLFAHDPCHDFYSGSRTLKDPGSRGNDIVNNLQIIFDTVGTKKIVAQAATKKTSKKTKNALVLSTNNPDFEQKLMSMSLDEAVVASKDYVKTVFVKDFTNLVFSDAVAEAVKISSNYAINDKMPPIVTAKKINRKDDIIKIEQTIKTRIYKKLTSYSMKSLAFYDVYASPILGLLQEELVEVPEPQILNKERGRVSVHPNADGNRSFRNRIREFFGV
jgi:hypothetical protein